MFRRPILATLFVLALMLQTTCAAWCIMLDCRDGQTTQAQEVALPSCHHASLPTTPEKAPKECKHHQVLSDAGLVQARTTLVVAHQVAIAPVISELPTRPQSAGFVVPVRSNVFASPGPRPLNLRI